MTNEPRAGNGLDPEMLAAYIDKRLPPDERAVVEAKLAADPESYELLVELIHANEALKDQLPQDGEVKEGAERDEPQVRTGAVVPMVSASAAAGRFGGTSPKLASVTRASAGGPKPKRTRGWMIAGGVLAAAAAVVLVVRLQPDLLQRLRGGDAVDPQLAKLVAAVGEERYIEARLTGGFKYGELRSVTRGTDAPSRNLALLGAAGELQNAATLSPTPANLHAWGVAQLQLQEYDGAINSLEGAVSAQPASPAFHNDLAAALAARAQRLARPEDWPRALSSVSRALAQNPSLLEGRFNRACILEGSLLRDQAIDAWREYLQLDSSSSWADEARRRLVALEQQRSGGGGPQSAAEIVSTNAVDAMSDRELALLDPALLTIWVGSVLVERWAEAPRSPVVARAISRISSAAPAQAADRWIPDTLLCLTGEPQSSKAEGLRAFAMGVRRAVEDRATDAHAPFVRAGELLQTSCPALSLAAHYHATQLPAQRGQLAEVLEAVRLLEPHAAASRYAGLQGLLLWRQGLAEVRLGRLESGLESYRRALTAFAASGQRQNEANVNSLIAEGYRRVGDMRTAWQFHRRSIELMQLVSDLRIRHQIFSQHSLSSLREGLPGAAVFFQAAMIANDREWGNVSALAMAHVQRARSYVQLADHGRALEDARIALELLPQISDQALRLRIEAEALASRAEALQANDAVSAITTFAASRDLFTQARSLDRAAAVALQRGDLLWVSGQKQLAASDWEDGLRFLRESRRTLTDAALRLPQATSIRPIMERLAGAAMERGEPAEMVVDWVERARFQTTVEILNSTGDPVGLDDIRHSLEPDTALVYYFDLNTLPFAAVLKRSGLSLRPLDRSAFAKAFEFGDRGKPGVSVRAAEEIYDAAVKPLLAELKGISTLVVVPDTRTGGVAWPGLMDRTTGRPLIDSFRIAVVPSGSVYTLLRRQVQSNPSIVRVESFGYGASADEESLPALPDAETEAAAVAAAYSGGRAWIGREADPARFVSALRRADLVHFAGHGIYNPNDPLMSRLLLAPSRTGRSHLLAEDIAHLSGVVTRVVVLAACQSAGAGGGADESTLGLTRPLLAAGVSSVIATVSEVDDALTARLMAKLHSGISRGLSPGTALRAAQLELFRHPIEVAAPHGWAAFAVYGLP